jgi:hypothetical protein
MMNNIRFKLYHFIILLKIYANFNIQKVKTESCHNFMTKFELKL